jgi:hypothetical protein
MELLPAFLMLMAYRQSHVQMRQRLKQARTSEGTAQGAEGPTDKKPGKGQSQRQRLADQARREGNRRQNERIFLDYLKSCKRKEEAPAPDDADPKTTASDLICQPDHGLRCATPARSTSRAQAI